MQSTEIIKDLIISILIVVCIFVILSVIFYDKISLGKVIPESEDYVLTEEMQDGINDSILEETKEVVTKYKIDAADLKKYEKTNEYNKGKKNPFAAEEVPSDTTLDNTTNNNTSSSNNESTNLILSSTTLRCLSLFTAFVILPSRIK